MSTGVPALAKFSAACPSSLMTRPCAALSSGGFVSQTRSGAASASPKLNSQSGPRTCFRMAFIAFASKRV